MTSIKTGDRSSNLFGNLWFNLPG